MSLLYKIRTIKKRIPFLIIGFIVFFLFFILLLLNHLIKIQISASFKNFTAKSEYTLISEPSKKLQKQKLFDYGKYHFYGYGINTLFISYQGKNIKLQNVLQEGLLNWEDILKKFTLVDNFNSYILTYENQDIKITVLQIFEEETEILFSKKNKF